MIDTGTGPLLVKNMIFDISQNGKNAIWTYKDDKDKMFVI